MAVSEIVVQSDVRLGCSAILSCYSACLTGKDGISCDRGVGFCCDVRGVRHKWNSGFACLPHMGFLSPACDDRTNVLLHQRTGERAIVESLRAAFPVLGVIVCKCATWTHRLFYIYEDPIDAFAVQ